MTALDLVRVIEAKGGTLTLRGDKIRWSVPEDITDLLEDVRAQRDAVIEVLRQREAGLPWPGYNDARQFCCTRCGAHFDTSVGKAWHEVNNCAEVPRPLARTTPLPSCPKCHGYALYHNGSGTVTCGTCGARLEANRRDAT